jgi:hypothetical protein
MAASFVGRTQELALLGKRLDRVVRDGRGVAVTIRGRRQVGKSRLVQEFIDRTGQPYFFFTATKQLPSPESTSSFLGELAESSLPPLPELIPTHTPVTWPDVWRIVTSALPDRPGIIVIDELPWLTEQDDLFDGALQTAWDRLLAGRPVLLLLLGSDLHMMERLTAYDRPFYGRADHLVLDPLNPAEVGTALTLPPADAIDAHLITGGLPGILPSWPPGMPALDFLRQECADPAAPVFSIPEGTLQAGFPGPDQTRQVLEAIAGDARTQANIAAVAGARRGTLPSGTLSPLLRRLVDDKRTLAIDQPLSTQPGRPALYRVADSNLRLYLAALRSAHGLAARGRTAAAYTLVERRWSAWRGRAVEPIIRESLELAAAAGELPWPDVEAVGGWWNRRFDPEIDLVGADTAPVARSIFFVGSVKWHASPVDARDVTALRRAASSIPGIDLERCGYVVASLSGREEHTDPDSADVWWGTREVVSAWS